LSPPYQAPSDEAIRDLLRARPVIAMVGASSKPHRPSHSVMGELLAEGYEVIPVNPRESVVHGRRAYPDLGAVPRRVDLVDVFRRPEEAPGVAHAAVAIGARVLWLQLGVISEEAASIAAQGGLWVVMDRCTIIEHRRLVAASPVPPRDDVGLCRTCRHARTVVNPRSTFWLCRKAATDPRFAKYPALPVLGCPGYERKSAPGSA
jgi:hypothetical protein